ncbi:MAG: Mur ligase family protein [Bacilli bacterium]|nr:Mur ligase family protein [Bacilli bacterium]
MRILILGFGKSGQASYNHLKEYDVDLFVYDQKRISDISYLSYEDLKRDQPLFDLCIRSPGISRKSKVYWLASNLSKKMISELELGLYFLKSKNIIVVTGTNGKTTTCRMINTLLSTKYKTYLVGNIGIPLTSKVKEIKEEDIVIIEASSYMLEDTFSLNPYISIITSLDENHLDGNLNIETYYSSKKRILFNSKKVLFSNNEISKKINYQPDEFLNKYKVKKKFTSTNLINLKTSLEVCYLYNLTQEEVNRGIDLIRIDKYRQEVIKKEKITFINDSKSTSIEATNMCIEEFKNHQIILILEGIFKGFDIDNFNFKNVKKIYSYGTISKLLPSFVNKKESLEEILKEIKSNQEEDVYVLFSPGGSSYDLYLDYLDRGKKFECLVNQLWK